MGDLNACTGIENHTLCLDNHISPLSPDRNSIQDGNWWSWDDKSNSYGRMLLKLCDNHNFKTANRQVVVDRVGNYTCFSWGGASAIDHLLVENSFHQKLKNSTSWFWLETYNHYCYFHN